MPRGSKPPKIVKQREGGSGLAVGLVIGVVLGVALAYFLLEFSESRYVLENVERGGVEVNLLFNQEYPSFVSGLLERSNKSIYVVMYVMKYDPKEDPKGDPVNYLISQLVKAKNRGVDVRVLVDDVTKQSYPDTITYLKSEGVPVRLDPRAGVTTHTKMVILDGEWVVLGSHNWTESALSSNNEGSVVLRSKDLAERATEYFIELWDQGRSP